MELWIRSQNKVLLEKVYAIKIAQYHNESIKEEDFTFNIVVNNDYIFGEYKTEKRALEILDEISLKIKNQYLVEIKPLVSEDDAERIELMLNYKYNGDFIMQPQETTITPINQNVIYYEMPEK